jgi:hypothetical protein
MAQKEACFLPLELIDHRLPELEVRLRKHFLSFLSNLSYVFVQACLGNMVVANMN